jgi:hypothetical protein
MPGGARNRSGGARGAAARSSRESGRRTTAASERDSTAQLGSQRPVQGSAPSREFGDTASSHQTGSESQPRKRPVRTVVSRIVSVLGAECGLDPTTVSLSEVSDWMEQSAHVIRICGERYTPPHKWSHLRGAAKLWSASAVRDLSGL